MTPDWNEFYFDAIERLGLTPADAEWHDLQVHVHGKNTGYTVYIDGACMTMLT